MVESLTESPILSLFLLLLFLSLFFLFFSCFLLVFFLFSLVFLLSSTPELTTRCDILTEENAKLKAEFLEYRSKALSIHKQLTDEIARLGKHSCILTFLSNYEHCQVEPMPPSFGVGVSVEWKHNNGLSVAIVAVCTSLRVFCTYCILETQAWLPTSFWQWIFHSVGCVDVQLCVFSVRSSFTHACCLPSSLLTLGSSEVGMPICATLILHLATVFVVCLELSREVHV